MTDTLRLDKYHGLGNDFLVVTADALGRLDPARVAIAACARHTGIGADGLLTVAPAAEGTGADLVMVLHNADGSRAEMSGNGIRCLVHAAVDLGCVPVAWDDRPVEPGAVPADVVPAGERPRPPASLRTGSVDPVRVATDAGLRVVTVGMVWSRPDTTTAPDIHASVQMGEIHAADDQAVVDRWRTDTGAVEGVALQVGNPHVVLRFDDGEALDAAADRLAAANPDANVELVTAGGDRGRIRMRVIERGVGETQACGTGASAAAWAARAWGLSDDETAVHLPGGTAMVVLDGDEATLSGPSRRIGRIDWEVSP